MGKKRSPPPPDPIRPAYERETVAGFYARHGADYRNPHEPAIRALIAAAVARWQLDLSHVLDLACGSGEATLALRELGCSRIDGIDPYTQAAYARRTGQAAEPYRFEQIADGALAGRSYSLIVCSFALHLLEPSRLPLLAYQLSQIAGTLLILTPHKRPALQAAWGWTLQDELLIARVRARLYRS